LTSTSKAAEADVAYIDAGKTLRQAGHLMRELGVAVLRVRGDNGEVQGTISQDMVVRRIAAGGDPKTVTVGEVAFAVPVRRRAPARSRTAQGAGISTQNPGLVARRRLPEIARPGLGILTAGLANHPRDGAHDLPEVSPPSPAVRAKRAFRAAPVMLVRSIRMPASAARGALIVMQHCQGCYLSVVAGGR
jgi:CBS domain-containing protein